MLKKILYVSFAILLIINTNTSLANNETGKTSPTIQGKPEGVTASDVYNACNKYFVNTFNTVENRTRKATCNGYFFGVGGTILSLEKSGIQTNICVPKNISTEQIIHDFLDWANSNSFDLGILATDGVISALTSKHPCDSPLS